MTVTPPQDMLQNGVKPFDGGTPSRTYQLSICICTFKRAEPLRRLLDLLSQQRTDGLFTFSVIVADNDAMQSARPVVAAFTSISRLSVTYCVEPQQNIALARNKALSQAEGDFVVFIDDDEFPADSWLQSLLQTCLKYKSDGVLGPIKPFFEVEPAPWVKKGGFFDRPSYATGTKMKWPKTRSGNVLLRRDILNSLEIPFRPEFSNAGEDVDFFRRMMEKGHTFVWCGDAIVYEMVPPSRCTRRFLLKRALLRGSNFPKHPKHRIRNIAKSIVAVPCYTLALPVLCVLRQDIFIKYLSKLIDHVSRLLAFIGLPLAKERET